MGYVECWEIKNERKGKHIHIINWYMVILLKNKRIGINWDMQSNKVV